MIARREEDCSLLDNAQNHGLCNIHICNGDGHPNCQCSDISYLLSAACDSCLRMPDIPSWENYSLPFRCPNSTAPTPFPSDLSSSAIPSWAIAMVSATPSPTTFNAQAATSLALFISSAGTFPTPNASSSTTDPTSSSSSSSSSSSPPTSTLSSSSPAETSSPSVSPLRGVSEKSHSNAGAIAGGLIGALVFLGLVVTGLLYLRRRRRQSHIAPSAAYMAALRAGEQPYHPVHLRDSMDEMRSVERPPERHGSPLPSSSDSLRNESRFLEHT
ncbi:hypothetical protein FB45DRAFT_913521 [Roridomyces roridus]|uniref:Uncharacterized protein n=1 Tax=Roridomyces roridus TaxID=1738132 RepID=A0AAD7FMV1_9AGAR|nr:hypothetical protein FB45DRAFT_913521 [Roridomyces roridus]